MNWYRVELHNMDPRDMRMITQLNCFSVTKTWLEVEAEDEAGAADEALYKYANLNPSIPHKPEVRAIDLIFTDYDSIQC